MQLCGLEGGTTGRDPMGGSRKTRREFFGGEVALFAERERLGQSEEPNPSQRTGVP